MATRSFINLGKEAIRYNSIKDLNNLLIQINNVTDYQINIASVYKDLFLYACKNGTKDICIWFIKLYYELSDIDQIALRQLFFYAKFVAMKNRRLSNLWFTNSVIPLIKVL